MLPLMLRFLLLLPSAGLVLASALILLALPAAAEKRVALVIGNSAYQYAPQLENPKNDATDMSAKLKSMGFEVTQGTDLNLENLRSTVREFVNTVDGADLALFFYAGHGFQVNGINYMAPVDVQLRGYDDLEFETLSIDVVLGAMERNAKVNLIFLDACRDNPLAATLARSMGTRSTSVGRGLARLGSGVGTLIAFSTQPGNVALDGKGRNSPFTAALLKHLGTPGQGVTQDLILVRQEVLASTDGKQVPWDNSSLTGDVVLVPAAHSSDVQQPISQPVTNNPDTAALDLAYWDSIKNEKSASYYQAYLNRFPGGAFADIARLRITALSPAEATKDEKVASQRTASIATDEATDGVSCPQGQRLDDRGQCQPAALGLAVFDGAWELTRTASNAKTCQWKELSESITISNGQIHSNTYSGSVTKNGRINIKLTFFYKGKAEYNKFDGRITNGKGAGKFFHVGGACKGTFTLSR